MFEHEYIYMGGGMVTCVPLQTHTSCTRTYA